MTEQWKPVEDWPYEVSNFGRVRHKIRKKVRATRLRGSRGGRYPAVDLWNSGRMKTVYVHRLVATAFRPNPRGCKEVHHKDTNKSNPRADNLRWCTRKEHTRMQHESFSCV